MNIKILLFALFAGLATSCTSTYRNTQTPDDVYFSPIRAEEEDYREDRRKDESKRVQPEEREIRMAVYDRRWRDFDDDYDYRYDPYNYGYHYGYYYNPYYCHYPVYITNIAIVNPKNSVPRMTNLGSYNYNTNISTNTKFGSNSRNYYTRPYNNSNKSTGIIRRILTIPTNTNSSPEPSNNTRTYTPSSGSSSSSGSSGAPVSRPARRN